MPWASKPWNCSSTPVHGLYQAAESATSLRLYNVDVFFGSLRLLDGQYSFGQVLDTA